MIHFVQGDLLKSGAEALVNPVNCVGVMGKGLAKQFKEAFPDMFKEYESICRRGWLAPGILHIYDKSNRLVINFPTKNHWRQPSVLKAIRHGLDVLVDALEEREIASVAIPKLGCGLGGLNWVEVRQLIVEALTGLDCDVYIYE